MNYRSIVCSVMLAWTSALYCTRQMPESSEVWLTVFVHGMMSIKHHLSVENFFRFLADEVEESLYAKTIDLMRQDPFFFQNQPMQGLGLRPIAQTTDPQNASSTAAFLFDFLYKKAGYSKRINHYYTFGWSGFLSASARYHDAQIFFDALTKEVERLKTLGAQEVHICIVSYSHGANIALNLEAVRRNMYPRSCLRIDELFVLGVPIQRETDFLVCGPLFKKVYNIYSYGDRVQPIDIFSANRLLSARHFKTHTHLSMPKKVKQIELRIVRCRKQLHAKQKRFLARTIFNPYCPVRSPLLRTVSPGHAELWFFGWTPLNYRPDFPLHPMPSMSLIPFITRFCEERPSNGHLIFEVRQDFHRIVVRQHGSERCHVLKFLSKDSFAYLKEALLARKPETYSEENYQKHVRDAFEAAKAWQRCQDLSEPSVDANAYFSPFF